MAGSRRRPAGRSGGSAAYQRRNERARQLGYRNYYDYRIHDHGRRPPDEPPPAAGSAERTRLRGHRGPEDLVRSLKPGDVLIVPEGLAAIEKDRRGRYKRITVLVLRENGHADRYTIRRADYDRVAGLLERMADKGAIFSPSPSLDLRRLLRVSDRPDTKDELEAAA